MSRGLFPFFAILAACGGREASTDPPTATLVTGTVGDGVTDGGATPYACSLLGVWHGASAPWNGKSTDVMLTFNDDGTFTGTPAFTGNYQREEKSLTVLGTSGADMACAASESWAMVFSPNCASATLSLAFDNCTGTRRYLHSDMTLTR